MKTTDENLPEHLPKLEIPVLDQLFTPTVIGNDHCNRINLALHATIATEMVIDRTIAGTYTLISSRIDNIVQQ
jgi:hypothetical protein